VFKWLLVDYIQHLTFVFYQLNAERGVFVIAIGVLLTLHFVWFWKMLKKGYREIVGSGGGGGK
jgi:hypothetical protein